MKPEFKVGEIVYFDPIYDLNRAKAKIVSKIDSELFSIELLEPFKNTYLDLNVGDLHSASPAHLRHAS